MTDKADLLTLLDEVEALVDQRLDAYEVATKAEGYKPLRKRYNIYLFGAMNGYLTMGDNIRAATNEARQIIVEHFYEAFSRGYTEVGGDEGELIGDSDDLAWINARTEEELGYVKQLFVTLKELKADPEQTRETLIAYAHQRADAYTDTLDAVYGEGKMRGSKNIMLTMVGEDGDESCTDCQERKGKRYSVRKWLKIGYPPSREFECRGYRCQHYLVTDDGKRFTP